MERRIFIGISILLMAALAFLGGIEYSRLVIKNDELDVLVEVLDDIRAYHPFYESDALLIEGAIDGMIETLNDPHSAFFTSEESEAFSQGLQDSYVGIGIGIVYFNNQFLITEVMIDSPAEAAGIRANDVIVEVDGVNIEDMEFYDGVALILGEVGESITLGVKREGVSNTIYLTAVRQVMDNITIKYEMIDDENKIGYIQIISFGSSTDTDFLSALQDLENQNMQGLIVDVRNNGGGYLDSVTNILDNLLTNDSPYMYVAEGDYEYNFTGKLPEAKSYPIVTLINEGSASASEVFASALKEEGLYDVIGVTSYGKGTMQSSITLFTSPQDELHLTIGKWFTPDHNWVNGVGVTPTIEVAREEYYYSHPISVVDGNYEYDMVSTEVANIQVILTALGYHTGRTDGYFDLDTELAVENYQLDNSLTVTGIIDEETANNINLEIYQFINNEENDNQLIEAINYFIE